MDTNSRVRALASSRPSALACAETTYRMLVVMHVVNSSWQVHVYIRVYIYVSIYMYTYVCVCVRVCMTYLHTYVYI